MKNWPMFLFLIGLSFCAYKETVRNISDIIEEFDSGFSYIYNKSFGLGENGVDSG